MLLGFVMGEDAYRSAIAKSRLQRWGTLQTDAGLFGIVALVMASIIDRMITSGNSEEVSAPRGYMPSLCLAAASP